MPSLRVQKKGVKRRAATSRGMPTPASVRLNVSRRGWLWRAQRERAALGRCVNFHRLDAVARPVESTCSTIVRSQRTRGADVTSGTTVPGLVDLGALTAKLQVHILTPSTAVRKVVNMNAVALANATR